MWLHKTVHCWEPFSEVRQWSQPLITTVWKVSVHRAGGLDPSVDLQSNCCSGVETVHYPQCQSVHQFIQSSITKQGQENRPSWSGLNLISISMSALPSDLISISCRVSSSSLSSHKLWLVIFFLNITTFVSRVNKLITSISHKLWQKTSETNASEINKQQARYPVFP